MLTISTYRSVEDAYLACLQLASTKAEHHITARGNTASEVIGVGFRLTDPRQRLPYLAARKANPVFQYAEAPWYLAGRRDLEMIGYYAPSMRSSSPDGTHLGGSAYGYTIFNPADDGLSALDRILELLRTETDSQRGYHPVFSPAELAVSNNPNMACLAGLHFLVRDGLLHMVCHMRANDLDCGLLSDVFSFTVIQEYAAVRLGLKLLAPSAAPRSAAHRAQNLARLVKALTRAIEQVSDEQAQSHPAWASSGDDHARTGASFRSTGLPRSCTEAQDHALGEGDSAVRTRPGHPLWGATAGPLNSRPSLTSGCTTRRSDLRRRLGAGRDVWGGAPLLPRGSSPYEPARRRKGEPRWRYP
ncbi:thymidylate synthase [Streptomyces sp. NPDC058268]|uniref:thymidylate synthase n=1 Tax=Streptomyces sp. NPDC058268 TaxID=3346413 RepID=UPI0036E56630